MLGLRARCGLPLGREAVKVPSEWLEASPDPALAQANVERWLENATNAPIALAHLIEAGPLGQNFVFLLGASRFFGDILAQNPEMASIALDPHLLMEPISVRSVVERGELLFRGANSHSFRLDRLRYLKQETLFRLTLWELCHLTPFQDVILGISDLAEGIVRLALEACWQQFASDRGLCGPCPISVVGFGKFGTRELNYSSDIDLALMLRDDADETLEREATRFAESFRRSLTEEMGRGFLYRVDLNLRPYGRSGPLVSRMSAFEAYYRRYAEDWEVLALLRSRVVAGPEHRWDALREEICFKPARSEWFLDNIREMRARTDEMADPQDLKRAAGGIRDVEFFVQILQLMHGFRIVELRFGNVSEMAVKLCSKDLIELQKAEKIIDSYEKLRRAEHGLQIFDHRQTHQFPADPPDQLRLARALGISSAEGLIEAIESIRSWVRQECGLEHRSGGKRVPPEVMKWMESLPNSTLYLNALQENQDSLDRATRVAEFAPAFMPEISRNVALTELILSGEILEAGPGSRLDRPRIAALAALDPNCCVEHLLSDAIAKTVREYAQSHELVFDIYALGSLAGREMSFSSDLDLVLLHGDGGDHELAERQAATLLRDLRAVGLPVDLRLRPEGAQGLLVRSHRGIESYEAHDMEPWERMAISKSALIYGDQDQKDYLRNLAWRKPLDRTVLDALLAVKHRVETERIKPGQEWSDIKVGYGGLMDIGWTVHLLMWAKKVVFSRVGLLDRIVELHREKMLGEEDAEILSKTFVQLLTARHDCSLQGWPADLVSEASSNSEELLKNRRQVRALYKDTLERLIPEST